MMAVEIRVGEGELIPGKPFARFEDVYHFSSPTRSYDVRADGQSFLMVRSEDADQRQTKLREFHGRKVSIVLNWFQELEHLVPTDR